jgi:hypothetical protein
MGAEVFRCESIRPFHVNGYAGYGIRDPYAVQLCLALSGPVAVHGYMSVSQARELAATLVNAADAIEAANVAQPGSEQP